MLELLYTEDASETELTVKFRQRRCGLGIDVMRVLRAYAKGDPPAHTFSLNRYIS